MDHVTDAQLEKFGSMDSQPPDLEAEIKRIATLSTAEYGVSRIKEAKSLKMSAEWLDKAVAEKKNGSGAQQQDDAVVEELEPWPDPVAADILDEIRSDFSRYVVSSPEDLDASALWTLGTYCFDAFGIWPKLFLSSPEKRCGKTITLEVIEANAHRPLMASSISPSSIFRAVDAWKPCLLIDEADTFSKDNEELTGIINAGHRRRTAIVIRTAKSNDEHIPRKFSVWSPMAIAAIGRLKDTIMDRSIVVAMRRKHAAETVERLPYDLFERNQDRRRQCLRWAQDNADALRHTRVELPPHGNDRARDNWEPIMTVAKVIGGEWPNRAMRAFTKLSTQEEEESIGPMLLADIREVFDDKRTPKMFSRDLVDALVEMEDRPWCEWRRGKPMTQNSLSRLLEPYRVRSGTIRIGGATAKGYERKRFADAFERYLEPPSPVDPPFQTVTTSHSNNGAGSGQNQSVTNSESVTVEKSREPNNGAGCDVVTVEKPGTREKTPEKGKKAGRGYEL